MHYTSWDRTDTDAPLLLVEAGPTEIGRFVRDSATVDGQVWRLNVDKASGARATLPDGRVIDAPGNFRRDKTLTVSVGERTFTFVNESSNNWIVDDEDGTKVAQFSGGNNGVRKAILEFEGQTDLPVDVIAGLSWIARLILEARLGRSMVTLIGTLIAMSVVAVLAFLF